MAGEQKPSSVKVFNCTACGAGVIIRAIGQTISVVCGSCGSIIDSTNENYRIIEKAANKLQVKPYIPLGQRGKIRGTLWEVIGFMQRCDEAEAYNWREYLLFNPMKGFCWLTEFDGHWNYLKTVKNTPEEHESSYKSYATFMNKYYDLFLVGHAKVNFVLGEFYWRVRVGESVRVKDFINPPEILSSEATNDEVVWSIGEYIAAEEIKNAFPAELGPLPTQFGVAPNQPSAAAESNKFYLKWGSIFLGILLLLQLIVFIPQSSGKELINEKFTFDQNDPEKIKVTSSFELPKDSQNIEITLWSPVQNNWLEVQADLVDEGTGESEGFEIGVEYYTGFDSDGRWSEGSNTNDKLISMMKKGKYHLNIEATSELIGPLIYSVSVRSGVVTWSNFLWSFFLILIFPLFATMRRRSFEVKRWSNSDYSPYQSSEGSDDD